MNPTWRFKVILSLVEPSNALYVQIGYTELSAKGLWWVQGCYLEAQKAVLSIRLYSTLQHVTCPELHRLPRQSFLPPTSQILTLNPELHIPNPP